MSESTLKAAQDAAHRFVENAKHLPELIEAIRDHRTAEQNAPAEPVAADPTPAAPEADQA